VDSVRRSFWLSAADSYLAVGLQIASTVIIARILTPTEVGIFAIAVVFSTLANMFRDFGFAEYLIQARDLDSAKIRAALGMNVIASWSMAALLALAAPWIAAFYRQPSVGDVLYVLALNFVIVPFGAVVQSWFRRELNYKPIVITNTLSSIFAFSVSVTLALSGHGAMSLAWSAFAGIAVTVLGSLWYRPRGFPRWPSMSGITEVFHFGKYASGTYFLAQIGRGAPELVIGRVLGAAEVGIFSRTNGVVELMRRLLLRPVLQVCLPYFAKVNRESGELASAYTSSLRLLTGIGWPALGCLAATSYAAIRIIYGEQWMAAVPLARVLCLAFALELLTLLSREALLACGEARRATVLQLEVATLQIFGVMLAIPYGLPGACWGLTLAALGALLSTHRHLRVAIGLRWSGLIRACQSSAGVAAVTAGPLAAASTLAPIDEHNFIRWALFGSLSAVLLWLIALKLLRHPLWDEGARVVKNLASHGK
jgi:O-antigen/teichoic acid export membrane protein